MLLFLVGCLIFLKIRTRQVVMIRTKLLHMTNSTNTMNDAMLLGIVCLHKALQDFWLRLGVKTNRCVQELVLLILSLNET